MERKKNYARTLCVRSDPRTQNNNKRPHIISCVQNEPQMTRGDIRRSCFFRTKSIIAEGVSDKCHMCISE